MSVCVVNEISRVNDYKCRGNWETSDVTLFKSERSAYLHACQVLEEKLGEDLAVKCIDEIEEGLAIPDDPTKIEQFFRARYPEDDDGQIFAYVLQSGGIITSPKKAYPALQAKIRKGEYIGDYIFEVKIKKQCIHQ